MATKTAGFCQNCGAPEWVKKLGLCAVCYLSDSFHANGINHADGCDEYCPGMPEARKRLGAWADAAKEWPQ